VVRSLAGLLIVFPLFFIGCQRPTSPGEVITTVSGSIADAETGDPLANVTVRTDPPTIQVLTDADGVFIIELEITGRAYYRIIASKEGYAEKSIRILVTEGKNTSIGIQLSASKAKLVVTPTRLDFGRDQTDLALIITNEGTGDLEWIVTDYPQWLALSQTEGTTLGQIQITVMVKREVLESGIYSGIIAVSSNGGNAAIFVVVEKGEPESRQQADVVINELLVDPPFGQAGDANRDGTRHPYEDEFIELLNVGTKSIDISGWALCDDETSFRERFFFPLGTVLSPGQYVVLFGGGRPQGFTGLVFTDDGSIGNGLANRGDTVLLIDSTSYRVVDSVSYTNWQSGRSYTRWPEGIGSFVAHTAVSDRLYSPGEPAKD